MKKLVDTHCHIQLEDFDEDRENVIERTEKEVGILITIGIDEKDSKAAIEIADKYDFIYTSVGIHPHAAKRANKNFIDKIKKLAFYSKNIAIGETGLDFYRNLSPPDSQKEIFVNLLDLSIELKKPVIIHTRQAHKETKDILKKYAREGAFGVIHCFSGSLEDARFYLDLGFFISFAGNITYPKAENLRNVVKFIPEDMLLIETDAPFLAPQPVRGKRNEPRFIKHTYELIASVRKVSFYELCDTIYRNTVKLFKISSDT